MHAILSILTATVLLGHALLGCCWHHAHASSKGAGLACVEHEHGHDHSAPQDESDHKQQSTTCQEGSCVFVRGDGSLPIDQLSILAIDYFMVPASAITQAELRIVRAEYSTSQDLAPPSRLHLLHQILLI